MSDKVNPQKQPLLDRVTLLRQKLKLRPFDERVLLLLAPGRARVLRSEDIIALAAQGESYKYCLNRLAVLFRFGYLDRPRQQQRRRDLGPGVSALVYAIGNRGLDFVAKRLDMDRPRSSQTRKNRELNPLFVEHELLIGRTQACVHSACGRLGVQFLFWHQQGFQKLFYTSLSHAAKGKVELFSEAAEWRSAERRRELNSRIALEQVFSHSVAPDAYFALRTLNARGQSFDWYFLGPGLKRAPVPG